MTVAAIQELLDRKVRDTGLPGIAVLSTDGSFGTAGAANLETGEPLRPDLRFRIGSTTKTFTALVVLQLVAAGKVGLDDPVETWLPGLVRGNGHDGGATTIRQLLSMTSGIANYSLDEEMVRRYYSPAFLEHRFDRYTPEQLVEIAMRNPADHPPGEGWTYSNTGYILAGMIIERATGATYAEEVTRRIIGPLGLDRTYVPGDETALRDAHPRLYSKNGDPSPDAALHDVTEQRMLAAWSAGGMVSTLSDLTTFVSAVLRGELLPAAQQEQLFVMHPTEPGTWIDDTGYGMGMASFDLPGGETVWGMGGAINGSWCLTLGTRDGSHVVAQHVNGDWGDPIGIFVEILDAELGSGAVAGSRSQ